MSVRVDLTELVSIWDKSGDLTPFAGAIGGMWQQVEEYAEDTDFYVGWQPLWDVDIAPSKGLPWLCMMAGERAPAGATDDRLRALIRAAPNQDRGTPLGIVNAIKQVLTGSQAVGTRERFRSDGTADDDALSILTFDAETPDVNAVLGAIRRTAPADIDVYYQHTVSDTWATLQAGGESWATLQSTYGPTWAAIQGSTPGYVFY